MDNNSGMAAFIPTSTNVRSTLDSVQALRGFAALLVVFYHAAISQNGEIGPGIWDRGYAGVDMFFVISGFILAYVTHTYARNLRTTWRFLYARATRVYPLWWIFALILPLYYMLTYGEILPPDRITTIPRPFGYVLKSLLLWPQTELPVLNVGWTLIHEIFFYLVFSFALLFRRSALPLFLGIWAMLTLFGYWLVHGAHLHNPFFSLITSPLTLEFIAGASVGLAVRHHLYFKPRTIFLVGAVGFIAALALYTTHSPWGRVIVFTLPCCALLFGSVVLEQTQGLRTPGWCVAIGNWSYALYLLHPIVIIALLRLSREAALRLPEGWKAYTVYSEPGLAGNAAYTLALVGLSIASAAMTHKFLERPLLRLTRKIIQRPQLAT